VSQTGGPFRLSCGSIALVLIGCVGVPTPLAPAVTGSVGMPYNGVQTNAVELPRTGEGFVRFRPQSPNYWGNPRLIRAIERASANVFRKAPGGAPLVIGDLSRAQGGKISGHRSHRNGRDIDLLFYVTTPAGVTVRSPGFVAFDSDGLAALRVGASPPTGYLRLDLERQWLLVKELLSSEEAAVQFMFVSHDIEALLIDYARARGEAPELVFRAETVLLEPGDSTSHNDHIHLRIACTPEEAVAGCEGGPLWEWLPAELQLGPLDAAELGRIAAEDPLLLQPSLEASGAAPATSSASDAEGDGA
jgi:penicillin-insensitive murein DD-endopeptidase